MPRIPIKEHVFLFEDRTWVFDAPFRVGCGCPVEENIRQGFMRTGIVVIDCAGNIPDCRPGGFRIDQTLQVRFDSLQQLSILLPWLDDALRLPTAKIDAQESEKIGRDREHSRC